MDALTILHAEACDADNLMVFETAGIYTDDRGALLCLNETAQLVDGSYIYQGSSLTVMGGMGQAELKLTKVVINGDVMTFSGVPQKLAPHAPINVNFTLQRQ